MIPWRFVDTLPSVGVGWYAHYEHRVLPAPGWQPCDIRGILRGRQQEWLDAFDAWHAQVCRAALSRTPWWWLVSGSRPNLMVLRETLKPLFFAAAVCEWKGAHPAPPTVHLLGCPPAVRCYLEELDPEGVCLGERGAARRLGSAAQALQEWRARLTQLLAAGRRRTTRMTRAGTLFYSHVLTADALEEAGDHFFGPMMDIASALPRGAATAYLLHDNTERARVRSLLERAGRRFAFTLDHVTGRDAAWSAATALWTSARLARLASALPPLRFGRWSSRFFAKRFVREHVASRPPVLELAIYRAMRRLLAESGAGTVVYPYEEKGLERAILMAARQAGHPVRALAYAHAAHSSCHVALRTRPQGMPNPPQPDGFLATGPQAAQWLTGWAGKDPARVTVVGSARYTDPMAPARSEAARRESLRVLVLVGPGYELETLAAFVEREPGIFAGCEVRIRRYEFAWKQAQDRGEARLLRAAMAGRIRIASGGLRDQLAWCDVALFSSTSAGIQAMLAGRLAAYVDLSDLFEADPLVGERGCVARCTMPVELAVCLAQFRLMSDAERAERVRRQRAFAASLYAPLEQDRLCHLLAGHAAAVQTGDVRGPVMDQPDALPAGASR